MIASNAQQPRRHASMRIRPHRPLAKPLPRRSRTPGAPVPLRRSRTPGAPVLGPRQLALVTRTIGKAMADLPSFLAVFLFA